jgi:hypothetical protein
VRASRPQGGIATVVRVRGQHGHSEVPMTDRPMRVRTPRQRLFHSVTARARKRIPSVTVETVSEQR